MFSKKEASILMEDKFSLPANSWDKNRQILQGFWKCWIRLSASDKDEKSVSLDDIAQTSGINRTLVSANNAFLRSIGVIAGRKTFKLTELGQRLAKAIDFDVEEDIKKTISEIVKQSDFLTKITDAVRIRKSMTSDALKNHIALTAGLAKTDQTMQGAKAIIDFLLEGNLLETDGENFFEPGAVSKTTEKKTEPDFGGFFRDIGYTKPVVEIQNPKTVATLQIKLNLTANDLKENPKELVKAIREFLEELNKPQAEATPDKDQK